METVIRERAVEEAAVDERAVDEQVTQDAFLAVVLGDEDLLRAEFDAIVAAAWSPEPPAHPPVVPVPSGSAPGGDDGFDAGDAHVGRRVRPGHGRPGADGWGRERSPPG